MKCHFATKCPTFAGKDALHFKTKNWLRQDRQTWQRRQTVAAAETNYVCCVNYECVTWRWSVSKIQAHLFENVCDITLITHRRSPLCARVDNSFPVTVWAYRCHASGVLNLCTKPTAKSRQLFPKLWRSNYKIDWLILAAIYDALLFSSVENPCSECIISKWVSGEITLLRLTSANAPQYQKVCHIAI